MRVDTGTVLAKLRKREEGFGLIELLMAMLMLNIGVLAIVAAFSSGTVAVKRASRVSTASVLADQQMELYRALTYSAIALDPSSLVSDSAYTGDAAYSASQVTGACPGSVASNPQCDASRPLTGPDGGRYRVDTYIVSQTPTNGRPVKLITVVVRNDADLTARPWVRQASSFDESTGL